MVELMPGGDGARLLFGLFVSVSAVNTRRDVEGERGWKDIQQFFCWIVGIIKILNLLGFRPV